MVKYQKALRLWDEKTLQKIIEESYIYAHTQKKVATDASKSTEVPHSAI